MTAPPAWILAWERGFAAGEAARAEGRRTPGERDLEDAMAGFGTWVVGFHDGLDPERPVAADVAPLAFAVAETLAGAWLFAGVRGPRRWLGALAAWAAFNAEGPLVKRLRDRRAVTRADVPPPRAMKSLGLRMGWNWGRRRRREGPWTSVGLTLPIVFDIERRRRSDLAAWQAHRASGTAGADR